MYGGRVLPVFLALIFAIPSGVADSSDYAPTFAVRFDLGLGTLVGWTPGEELAEAHRVYGLNVDATPVLLGTFLGESPQSAASSLVVHSGYATYAVSGVVGSAESPMTTAALTRYPCVDIQGTHVELN